MQSPEILLAELNGALRRLRGACGSFESEDINRDLLPIMRRLLLAEVLGNTWILAVGGSQGAGKTTLMSTLYDLRCWRRFKIEPPCRLNFEPGLLANR